MGEQMLEFQGETDPFALFCDSVRMTLPNWVSDKLILFASFKIFPSDLSVLVNVRISARAPRSNTHLSLPAKSTRLILLTRSVAFSTALSISVWVKTTVKIA